MQLVMESPSKDKLYQDEGVDWFIFQITNSLIVQEYETILYLTDSRIKISHN